MMLLHTKIKNLLIDKVPNIAIFLKDVGLPLSYLGVRYFLTGKQEKMGEKGLQKIIEKLGYEMVLVPVKTPEAKKQAIELQDMFIDDLEEYLKKFASDKKTVKRRKDEEPIAISSILTDLDTSSVKKNLDEIVEIDLGITAKDLF